MISAYPGVSRGHQHRVVWSRTISIECDLQFDALYCRELQTMQRTFLSGSDIVDNNLLRPGVVLVPVKCANRVNGFIGAFNFSCNILINITIVKYSSHPFFPFMPIIICQVVMFSDLVLVNVCIIPGAN